jgi:two-component system NtrC family sensor kinase
VIVEETKRCKKIVEELLEFSRQREPSKSLTDVNRLVEDTLAVVEKQHFFHNTKIVRQYHVSLPGIMADSSQLKQVFMNIILNAQEAMPDRGVLTVRTTLSEDRRMVEVRFTDTGHGIHKEDLPRLFDPFFTTKGKTKGTGLGLSVSLGIVTRHGGSIEVSSTLGQGATFTVKLPVEKEA